MSSARFGQCCKDMNDAIGAPHSVFRVADNGVLYLPSSIRADGPETTEAHGYFDLAVLYCPFCGKQLQDVDDIAKTMKI